MSSRVLNLSVVATALLAGLVLAEVLTRWFVPQQLTPLGGLDPAGLQRYDPEFGFFPKPNFAGPWVRGVFVETNSLGLRDRDYGPKGENEIRILSLGDSYAFGYGVQLSDSYPKILEKMLAQDFPESDVFVINGAVSGYNTYQQILMFDKLFPLMKPDFVLATFVGSNDVIENAKFNQALEQKMNTPSGWLDRRSHLVRLIRQATFPAEFFSLNRWNPNIDHTIQLLAELEARFKANNLPYLMLVIPARHQIRPDVHPGSSLLARIGLDWLILHQNRRVMAYFETAHTPYIDLQPILASHDQMERVSFIDDSHTNIVGHRVIGEAVYRRIAGDIAKLRAISSQSLVSSYREERGTGSRAEINR